MQRTSYFLAVTTFGQAGDAQEAIGRVRAVHQQITGTAPDGRPYAASDPRLLTWVHIAETDSFLHTHTHFGTQPLDQAMPSMPVTETVLIRPAGQAMVHAIRWAITAPPRHRLVRPR